MNPACEGGATQISAGVTATGRRVAAIQVCVTATLADLANDAQQFIKDLTLEYNKMRQASITTELLEISTAQMAISG